MQTQTQVKPTIRLISKNIKAKRDESLDTQTFPIHKLGLSPYDIRETRDIDKMKDDLLRDGQLQPITVTFVTNKKAIVVNGRTRYLAILELIKEGHSFPTVNIEVYSELTQMEQDYLNAQINVSQKSLTSNEKLAFVDKYKDKLDPLDLGEALGLSPAQTAKYKAVSKMSPKVRAKYTQKTDGNGRGEINIETGGDTVIAYEAESGGVCASDETLMALGDKIDSINQTRDKKRKLVRKMSKKTAEIEKDARIAKTYTPEEIVEIATAEVSHNNGEGGSGDKLPKNSAEKYKIIDNLLKKETYEFAILLFAESLYRVDDVGNEVASETKRIVDQVQNVMVVGNEIIKLTDIEEYGKKKKKKVIVKHGDVIETCNELTPSTRKGIIYVNGASLYAQRPEFMNYLKKKYPNSTIAMVVLDLLFGKSKVYKSDRDREIITVYGGAKNFNQVLEFFKGSVKHAKIREYATKPQKKYIIYS